MRRLFILLLSATFLGCSHQPVSQDKTDLALSPKAYEAVVNTNTVRANQFSGFYQTFQADVTILTTEMQMASLRQRASFMQWDAKQYQAEREKMQQENSAYAKFFLRFYSPEHDYDDLHKGKTIWKVYLDVSGQRFEGKVKKLTDKLVELMTIYPHFDRFSTPYEVTFNVPMTTIENGKCKVTLTSSLGTAEFDFPTKK